MKELIVIAAMSENNVIGINGQLPWKISEDLYRFRDLTLNNTIIMGRKTFESIGGALPKRENIVLTRQISYSRPKILTANTLEEAIEIATEERLFFIGGAEVYAQAIPLVNKLMLTKIHRVYNGDSFFPEVDYSKWGLDFREDRGNLFSFLNYSRLK